MELISGKVIRMACTTVLNLDAARLVSSCPNRLSRSGAGYSGDGGEIYDDETKLKRTYSSHGFSFGIEAGANVSVVIGLWKDHVTDMKSGWARGSGAGSAASYYVPVNPIPIMLIISIIVWL